MENLSNTVSDAVKNIFSPQMPVCKKAFVLGDIMVDQYLWGEVERVSPEAPVPVVDIERETIIAGGAANVACNLKAMGLEVFLAGIAGNDLMGETLLRKLEGSGISSRFIVLTDRPTTLKMRIVARGQQMIRVDRERRDVIDSEIEEQMLQNITKVLSEISVLVVSDYAKGVISPSMMARITALCKANGVAVFVDPKPANKKCYQGVTLITPNEKEALAMTKGSEAYHGSDKDAEALCKALQRELGTDAVLMTCGAKGMALWQKEKGFFMAPTMAREVFDVTGAGDTALAGLTLGWCCGLRLEDCVFLANVAAGIAVGKIGTSIVTLEEIKKQVMG